MTDKRKKRIKELARQHGISHRSAANMLDKQRHEREKAARVAAPDAATDSGGSSPTTSVPAAPSEAAPRRRRIVGVTKPT